MKLRPLRRKPRASEAEGSLAIEEAFRDQKDIRFRLGLSSTHIEDPDRRDRLLMLAPLAQRQGRYWYLALPNLREERLRPLVEAFGTIVLEHQLSRELLGVI